MGLTLADFCCSTWNNSVAFRCQLKMKSSGHLFAWHAKWLGLSPSQHSLNDSFHVVFLPSLLIEIARLLTWWFRTPKSAKVKVVRLCQGMAQKWYSVTSFIFYELKTNGLDSRGRDIKKAWGPGSVGIVVYLYYAQEVLLYSEINQEQMTTLEFCYFHKTNPSLKNFPLFTCVPVCCMLLLYDFLLPDLQLFRLPGLTAKPWTFTRQVFFLLRNVS